VTGQPPDRLADQALLAAYARQAESAVAWDEMVAASAQPRPAWRDLATVLDGLGPGGLVERRRTVERLLADDGVSYRPLASPVEQPWDLDPIPLLLDATQWATLERGLVQRAELLDLILTDLYGPRTLLQRGLLPPEVVYGHAGFLREVDQIRLSGLRQLFLSACDLVRDNGGRWIVLSDRTQAPSGAGYAMENRRVVSRTMAELHRDAAIRRIGPFFHAMRLSLQQAAPNAYEVPRVVLLTPGAQSETAFDQAYLSSLLGFPLVEGADLTVRAGRVWQRSIGRLEPVDVILRRVDSWSCDPLELRPDSTLGVPGLVEACRLGSVSVVNPLSSGVLENPALFPFLPAVARALLDAPLGLECVPTWWCGEDISRHHVLARMDRLVVKPVSRPLAGGSRFGWELSSAARDDLVRRIEAEPYAWVGQEPLTPSTVPTVVSTGLEARPAVLRTFAVAEEASYRIMAGGLVRAAPRSDVLLVSNQDGAVSKDVWILGEAVRPAEPARPVLAAARPPDLARAVISPRVAEDLFWLGRYAERAEAIVRLLRVTEDRWRDEHPDVDPALARCLVVLLEAATTISTTWPGFVGDGSGPRLSAPRAELLALVRDEQRPGTVAHDVRRLRALASAVRDQLSSDTWIALNGLDRGLRLARAGAAHEADRRGLDDLPGALAALLEALLAFAGLAAESMVRDAGWHAMDAGRRLERAIQVVELLRTTLVVVQPPEVDALVAESVLIAAESIITHRRRNPAGAGLDSVLRLLLADRGNPRSFAYQLDRLVDDVAHLPVATGADTAATALAGHLDELVARLSGFDDVTVSSPAGGRRERLSALLDDAAGALREVGRLIEAAHFLQPAPLHTLGPLGERHSA
jgi:uncharacterized circularly permuted ATP-grasp superfamily protein/uncharacterized alpha-E superfamily protein